MQTFLYLILPILLLTNDWNEFMSYDGKFSILVPGEVEEKVQTIETEVGTIEYHSFVYESKDLKADNLVYIVSYCDYPQYSMHSDSIATLTDFFDTTIESSRASVSGELIYSTEISLKDFPGRFWRISYKEGASYIKTKAYLVGNRFYTLQTVTLKHKVLNPSVDKFFDSFKLLGT